MTIGLVATLVWKPYLTGAPSTIESSGAERA